MYCKSVFENHDIQSYCLHTSHFLPGPKICRAGILQDHDWETLFQINQVNTCYKISILWNYNLMQTNSWTSKFHFILQMFRSQFKSRKKREKKKKKDSELKFQKPPSTKPEGMKLQQTTNRFQSNTATIKSVFLDLAQNDQSSICRVRLLKHSLAYKTGTYTSHTFTSQTV